MILRGCNLGCWFLIEPWMIGIPDRPDLKDQFQLETMLSARFGEAEKDRLAGTFPRKLDHAA